MIELLSPAEMAEADRLTVAGGIAGMELMENAGRAVAEAVARFSVDSPVLVVAGPGNNGGDGFVAARLLAERGHQVRVILLGEPAKLKGDAAVAAGRWKGPLEAAHPDALQNAGIVIDAVFGAGLDRPVEGAPAAMIEAVNAAGLPVIAVDLPSGVSGATGAVMGVAVKAAETVTFFRRKPGHLLLPGRTHCGKVTVADIGIRADTLSQIRPKTFANAPELWTSDFPWPQIGGHKYSRGHAAVVSGGLSFTGAARLAARGALRAGAGLVTIASPREALAINAAASLAVMVRPVDGAAELGVLLADRRRNAILLGPGGGVGERMRDMVGVALQGDRAAVLDADALTSFADRLPNLVVALSARGSAATVVTPHGGEFSQLFQSTPEVTGAKGKLAQAIAAARHLRAIVLLKGPDTVIAAPDGRAAICDNAPPWLATAGTGDVLAGMILGLLAQGMPPFEAAAAAAWLHGEAANAVGPGLISEDLPEALPMVYRRLLGAGHGRSPRPPKSR